MLYRYFKLQNARHHRTNQSYTLTILVPQLHRPWELIDIRHGAAEDIRMRPLLTADFTIWQKVHFVAGDGG